MKLVGNLSTCLPTLSYLSIYLSTFLPTYLPALPFYLCTYPPIRDLICAAIHNDLGLVHKSRSQFDAAQESYQKAVHTRRLGWVGLVPPMW